MTFPRSTLTLEIHQAWGCQITLAEAEGLADLVGELAGKNRVVRLAKTPEPMMSNGPRYPEAITFLSILPEKDFDLEATTKAIDDAVTSYKAMTDRQQYKPPPVLGTRKQRRAAKAKGRKAEKLIKSLLRRE